MQRVSYVVAAICLVILVVGVGHTSVLVGFALGWGLPILFAVYCLGIVRIRSRWERRG